MGKAAKMRRRIYLRLYFFIYLKNILFLLRILVFRKYKYFETK